VIGLPLEYRGKSEIVEFYKSILMNTIGAKVMGCIYAKLQSS
jgi:hypothetical protein